MSGATRPSPQEIPGRRIYAALAGLHARVWFHGLRRGLGSDPLPGFVGVLLLGASIVGALGLGAVLLFVAVVVPEDGTAFWFSFGLLASLILVGLLSAVAGEGGDLVDLQRLQVFPIARRRLLVVDLVAEATSPAVAFFVPAVLGLALGLGIRAAMLGRPAGVVLAPAAVLVAFLADAALVRTVLGRVSLGGRRTREVMGIVLVGVFMTAALAGPLLEESGLQAAGRIATRSLTVLRFTWPGAAASIASGGGSLLDLAVLAGWTALLLAAHRRVAGRLLDGEGGYRASVARSGRRAFELDRLLPGPVGAVLAVDLRTLSRMPTLWILMMLPVLFGFLLGTPPRGDGPSFASWTAPMAAIGLNVFLTVQLFSNMFGTDHGGAAAWLLSPVRASAILLGKAASRLVVGGAQMALFLGVLRFRMGEVLPPGEALLAWLAWLVTAFWVLAPGALISIRFPYRMAHGVQKERSARGLLALLGQFAALPAVLPPALMILGGRAFAGSAGYAAGIAVSAAGGIALAMTSFWLADDLLDARGPEMVEALGRSG